MGSIQSGRGETSVLSRHVQSLCFLLHRLPITKVVAFPRHRLVCAHLTNWLISVCDNADMAVLAHEGRLSFESVLELCVVRDFLVDYLADPSVLVVGVRD